MQKGPNAFKATKVKGHATQGMIEAGKVRPKDKEGNDLADKYAEEGIKLYGEDTLRLGAQLTGRNSDYAKMLQDLHASFIEAIPNRNKQIK